MIWATVLQGTAPEGADPLSGRRRGLRRGDGGEAVRPDDSPPASVGASSPTGDRSHLAAEAPGEDAFAALYAEVARPLATYVRRTLGNTEEAHDVVQEVFYRYLRAGLPAGTAPETARPYLYRSATHLLRDRWRRAKRDRSWRESLGFGTERSESSAPAPEERTLSTDLDRAFRKLKPRDRALLWLAHVEGASHREIADALSVGEASVRVMLFRARKKMEKVLEETGFPTEEWR